MLPRINDYVLTRLVNIERITMDSGQGGNFAHVPPNQNHPTAITDVMPNGRSKFYGSNQSRALTP